MAVRYYDGFSGDGEFEVGGIRPITLFEALTEILIGSGQASHTRGGAMGILDPNDDC